MTSAAISDAVNPVLSIRGVHLAFASRDPQGAVRRAHVLNGVELEVGPGRIVGLIGETGAGKSMTATATIVATQRKDVLLVPNAALRFKPADDAAGAATPAAGGARGGFADE